MKNTIYYLSALFFGSVLFQSCLQDNVDLSVKAYSDEDYAIISEHLNLPLELDDYSVLGNNRNDIATLGRVLFYDNNLSIDNSKNCSSCHSQKLGFADDKKFSEGIDGAETKRNSLAIGMGGGITITSFYETFSLGFFWDERASNMRAQIRETIENEDEMGMDMRDLVDKLSAIPYYKVLFKKAFQNDGIIEDHLIITALESFVNSISTKSSKLEESLNVTNIAAQLNSNEGLAGLNASENRGKSLFMSNCATCHSASISPSLTHALDLEQFSKKANNGLDLVYEDQGIYGITGVPSDKGKFKVPFLKNIALTKPYMHDGRFATLEEVVDHYSDGIQNHTYLSSSLKAGNQAKKFNFSAQDKTDLVNFLHTMTDDEMINNPKYSDPFL